MLQPGHPDVRVKLIDDRVTPGSATVSDAIGALSIELLDGNGVDLSVLDGLLVEPYIEKGILEDMRDLLSPMIALGELTGQMSKPYAERSGSIYQIPTRMTLLAAYGSSQAAASLMSMEVMRVYQEDPFHLPLRPKTNYESLLCQVPMLRYDEVVDIQTGKSCPDKAKEPLETVKVLGEANGAKSAFDKSEGGGRGNVYNLMLGLDELLGNEYSRVDQGMSAVAIDKIDGIYNILLPLAVRRKRGSTMEDVNASYLPSGTMGVNQACQSKEMAREFIPFMLGHDVRSKDLSDGLPVNTLAVQDRVDREDNKDTSVAVSGDDGHELTDSRPAKEEHQLVFDVVVKADHPIRMDRVLTDTIINETKGYFEGRLSLERAARNTQDKAMLYFLG